ncbi:hypothetical protein ANN_21436 [Periplaneta americana]|uniref:Histone-lysine N-methyltransferase SETMAR n=1 Tax=Periplaneta americana TaxID=6978 RepID=A0ABQ8SGG1_PERAM|nr:hypothetical protein ANN_21436 [Periplaneta americana]
MAYTGDCEMPHSALVTLFVRVHSRKFRDDSRRSKAFPEGQPSKTAAAGQVPPRASSVAAVVRNGISYSFSRRLRGSLCQVYGPNIMSKQMVRRWSRQFSEGRQSVHDEERSGRPSLINDDPVELVRQFIMENRRFTITELSSHFPKISRSLLHEIVTKHLLFKKVCARRVPKNLTPEHKMQRLGAALTFLQRYHDDGDEFLDRIITGDETWISHFTPETKRSQCIGGIVDLRDFHVFLHLKKFLSSDERFGNDEELKTSVTRWFHSQAAEFYDRGIQKLIPQYDKCLNSDGGYVEK